MQIEKFRFRDLHPMVLLGTASDRYAGWLGQIYTQARYEGRVSRRTHTVGGKSFAEETLPVESVAEYFEHFQVLEIDYTFYSLLLDADGRPTRSFHVLKSYRQHLHTDDRLILKAPQTISARRLHRGDGYAENETYLNAQVFTRQFFEPAMEILGSCLSAIIFEQEYQRRQDRIPAARMAADLDRFFAAVPADSRYHIELRTEAYLSAAVFAVMAKHGVGQVLSHWTWLPPLKKQLAKADSRVFNSGKQRIVRLMTPIGMRYEDAYALAHPFDKLVDGMLQPAMVREAVELMRTAAEEEIQTSILINNRSGGNAPTIAQRLAMEFLKG